MHLAANEELHVLHVLPLLPAPRQHVPLVRRRHDDVPLRQQLQVSRSLPSQQHSSDAQPRELVVPARVDRLGDALEGRDVDAPAAEIGITSLINET